MLDYLYECMGPCISGPLKGCNQGHFAVFAKKLLETSINFLCILTYFIPKVPQVPLISTTNNDVIDTIDHVAIAIHIHT